jgi:MFS family permease
VVSTVVFLYGVVTIGFAGLSQALVVETVGTKYAATGIGLFMTVTQLGKVVGPPLFGLVVDLTGAYRMGWFLMAGFAACGTAVAVASRSGEKHLD